MTPSLQELRCFEAVARRSSFRAAARELGLATSSVSHTIRTLEERFGRRLLNRTTRSVALTEAGQRLLERLQPILGDLDAAIQETMAQAGEITGRLRINASTMGARYLIEEIAPSFRERHPRVALELVTDDRLVDIVAEGCDAGVRLGETAPPDMIGAPFGGPARFIAVASPAYLDRAGRPEHPLDLTRHECIRIRFGGGRLYRWEFERGGEEIVVDAPGAVTLDRRELMVAAAERGLGVAYVMERLVEAQLRDGRLESVLDDWRPEEPGMVLYYPGRRLPPPPLRAFIDTLREVERARRRA